MPTSTANPLLLRRIVQVRLFALAVLLTGCGHQEDISTYPVPSHESIQTPEFLKQSAKRKPLPTRMVAAILPHGDTMWFFSLKGPPEVVEERVAEYRDLLKSVRFQGSDRLDWTLPSKWQSKPGTDTLYATLTPPDGSKLDAFVLKVPSAQLSVISIVNFCRNQLELPTLENEDLPSRTEKIESDGMTITLVDFTGRAKPKSTNAEGIEYEKPEEWTQVKPKQFILAAFQVSDGDKQVSITLSRAGGARADNVNRWRGQMGLKPLGRDEIATLLQKIEVGARAGELVELKNDNQIMLGLMLADGDSTVFVKLLGDPELAVRERGRFLEFAKSLSF